jgi:DmsE family decaheme c-type cytochrome
MRSDCAVVRSVLESARARAARSIATLVWALAAAAAPAAAEPEAPPPAQPAVAESDPAPASAPPDAAPLPDDYVGVARCQLCHEKEKEHWGPTAHGQLFERAPRTELEARGCESCHGPGGRHVVDPRPGTIVSFTRSSTSSVEEMNGMCLHCHAGGARIYWTGSTHESQGLACSDCHNPMGQQSVRGLEARASASATCFPCHPQQRLDFTKRSHMPLLEGKISCVDCHEPHGSATDPLIRADDVNQLCTQCHADKRGPFLWEHPPVVESCLNCHRPHGSNHEALLVAIPPFLCQQCHGQPGSFGHPNDLLSSGNLADGPRPDERLLNRGCVNCHVQIHGSNHPSGARFHR